MNYHTHWVDKDSGFLSAQLKYEMLVFYLGGLGQWIFISCTQKWNAEFTNPPLNIIFSIQSLHMQRQHFCII